MIPLVRENGEGEETVQQEETERRLLAGRSSIEV